MNNFKLGIQLYTVRKALAEDFYGTLKALKKMGIQGIELAFFYGNLEPTKLALLINKLELEVYGIYENFQNIADDTNKVYDYAKTLKCKYLTSGLGIDILKNDFNNAINIIKKACVIAKKHNISICYHAHSHEFETIDGEIILDKLLNAVPEMSFEADTAWIQCGGQDILTYMNKYANRIPLIHVKDVKKDNTITELGNGIINFKEVLEFSKNNQVEWVSYEQDTSELTPLKSTEISFKYLNNIVKEI
jgi:sugar phosphate isomerase/epimerase